MLTPTLLEVWSEWSYNYGKNCRQAAILLCMQDELDDLESNYRFVELLTAIALTGAFLWETQLRLRNGAGIADRATFLQCAAVVFLTPVQMCRAVQAGIEFSAQPPDVQVLVRAGDRRQESGGFGADHGVGGRAQNVYPILRKPK